VTEGRSTAIFIGAVVWIALLMPAAMIWGWSRWFKGAGEKSLSAKFALGGFVFANLSVVFALCVFLLTFNSAGSALRGPWLLRAVSFGPILAILGVVLSLAGLRRSSPLRWPGLFCAGGVLAFWMFNGI
jgi:hypothetical protein